MSRRKKGEIVWVKLGELNAEYQGAEVGLKHVGPKTTRRWAKLLTALQMSELKRIKKARAELDADVAPFLFADDLTIATPEGIDEAEDLTLEIVREVFAGVRHWPDVESLPHDEQLEELDRLDLVGLLVEPAREAQAVKPAQFPATAGAGDARPTEGPDPAAAV